MNISDADRQLLRVVSEKLSDPEIRQSFAAWCQQMKVAWSDYLDRASRPRFGDGSSAVKFTLSDEMKENIRDPEYMADIHRALDEAVERTLPLWRAQQERLACLEHPEDRRYRCRWCRPYPELGEAD